MDARGISGYVLGISLGIYFFAFVAVPALVELFGINITGLPDSVGTLVTTVVAIAVAAGAIMSFLPDSIKARAGL